MAALVMNMFPMVVTTPDGTVHKTCRVVSDGRDVTVWQWDGHDYVIVLEAPAEQLGGNGPTWTLTAGDEVTELVRQDGCGCGHPLKNHTPARTAGARRKYTDPAG